MPAACVAADRVREIHCMNEIGLAARTADIDRASFNACHFDDAAVLTPDLKDAAAAMAKDFKPAPRGIEEEFLPTRALDVHLLAGVPVDDGSRHVVCQGGMSQQNIRVG